MLQDWKTKRKEEKTGTLEVEGDVEMKCTEVNISVLLMLEVHVCK